MENKTYLDLKGLSHYHEKIKETFLRKDSDLSKEEIDKLFDGLTGNVSLSDNYELKVENNEVILSNKTTSSIYKLSIQEDTERVVSLSDETKIAPDAILIETIGSPQYVEKSELTSFGDYNLTSPGWYIFARIKAKQENKITEKFNISGVEGYIIPREGDTFVDVAIKFDVMAESQLVTIDWGETVENFLFKSTDLAIRNLDYRVTFYLYDIKDYTIWEYELTTDKNFIEHKRYYTKENNEYVLAKTTVGAVIPNNTYYVHSKVTFKDFVKNVSYCCEYIDCPVTIYLPEVDDENYGAWFEIQTQFDAARSITIIPSQNTKVSGKGVATPKAGINIINFQFHKPTKTWLPTITNWDLSST